VAARERDGFLDVNTGAGPRTERQDNDRSVVTTRGQIAIDPSDALDIRVIADYSKRDESCCASVQTTRPPAAAAVDLLAGGKGINRPAEAFDRLAYSNRSTEQEIEDMGASAEINADFDGLGGATLTSITAWRDWESLNAQDIDFTTADIWHRDPD